MGEAYHFYGNWEGSCIGKLKRCAMYLLRHTLHVGFSFGNPAGFAPKMPRTEPIRPDWCRPGLGQAQSCRRSTKKGSDNRNPAGFVLSEPRMGEIRADWLCPSCRQCLRKSFRLIVSPAGSPSHLHHHSRPKTKRTNPVSAPPRRCFRSLRNGC